MPPMFQSMSSTRKEVDLESTRAFNYNSQDISLV